ncbi:FxsA family protein [Amaricoccus sp.]|uniref:FxsA family protein n=1 Tax=Amaricoccus sp. TaxID=1872485 RepID=UPI00262E70D0|nr:FxsA family protein [uncultured Amaricoccus sp.]
MWILPTLILLPMIEIALFIVVGGWIGLWPTLALVIASAVGGMSVIRVQGTQALMGLRRNMEAGGDPRDQLAHGALILVAGILLLIPGFLTDAIAILLLIPPIRAWVIGRGAARMTVKATRFGRTAPPRQPPGTIDAEYEVIEDTAPRRPGNSGWTRPDG